MESRAIVGTKLVEAVSRGLFVLVSTYCLPVEEAGRFGLTATLVALCTFLLGYERQVDLLRRVAGCSSQTVRLHFDDTLKFFAVHSAWALPSCVAVVALLLDLSIAMSLAFAVVTLSELVANQSYQAALLDRRNIAFLVLAAGRSFTLVVSVALVSSFAPDLMSWRNVMLLWASVGALSTAASAMVWQWSLPKAENLTPQEGERQDVAAQYSASRVNFIVGAVAVAAVQADRLVIGTLLSAHEVGVYFRNATLAALALQIFSIVSFNRVAPGVYAHARNGRFAEVLAKVKAEYLKFAGSLICLTAMGLLLAEFLPGQPLQQLHISTTFVAVLALGVVLRAAADYAGLILLSLGSDAHVLRNQLGAVFVGIVVMTLAAKLVGLAGAIAASLSTPLVYFLLNGRDVRRRHLQ